MCFCTVNTFSVKLDIFSCRLFQMVFYADLRVPPFSVQVNGNFVRTVIEETHDIEISSDLLEAVCEHIETEVGYKL